MRAKLVAAAGVALSVGILVHIAWSFDLPKAGEALELANPWWLILAAAGYLALFPLRGLRWSRILAKVAPVSSGTATEVFAIGFLANNLMPARLGDVARAFVLAKRSQARASTSLTTVLLERVFDGLIVVGMLLLVLPSVPGAATSVLVEGMGMLLVVAFPAAILVAGLVAWNDRRALQLFRWVARPLPPALAARGEGLLERLTLGLHSLRSATDTLAVVSLSLLIWCAEVGVYVLIQRAFGLDVPLPGLMFVMAVLTLGLTLPSAPAFVGVFELLVVQALRIQGVPDHLALAFAVALHLVHFVPGTLLGAACAWRMGLKMAEIKTAGDRESDEPRPVPEY